MAFVRQPLVHLVEIGRRRLRGCRKLAEARRILGARNDTEAVDRALDAVVYQDEVFAALDRLAAAGGVTDVYARGAKSKS